MVATKSNMVDIGTIAPAFSLYSPVTSEQISFSEDSIGKGFLIVFICNHCPYVLHLAHHFSELFNSFLIQGIKVYAISSNDVQKYPQDNPANMAKLAKELNFKFPYLYDEDQSVAKLYKAACTPDLFLFDGSRKLFYRGQYDDSKPGNGKKPSGTDMINAVEQLLKNNQPPKNQTPSIGCNIKWK